MKQRMNLSLIAITCLGVLCPITANAENPLDKLIPRGTFLKKLKQEFIGEKPSTPTPASIEARPEELLRKVAIEQRTPRQAQQLPTRHQVPQRRQRTLATRPLPPMEKPTQGSSKQAISSSVGFGTIVQMAKNNQMVVTRLHPQGNGVKAGLKPGDVVTSVGSVELTSAEVYQQVTEGLKPGDMMEFEFVRRGKPQKALVQFGTAPEVVASPAISSVATKAMPEHHVDSNMNLDGVPSVLDGSVQPVARVSQLPPSAPSVVSVPGANEQRLQRTIESQRAKMERMEQELEMLRRTNTPAIRPTENNWALPDLSSPN